MPAISSNVVLEDSLRNTWEVKYLVEKQCLSEGWRRFAKDYGLPNDGIVTFTVISPLAFSVRIDKKRGKTPKSITSVMPIL